MKNKIFKVKTSKIFILKPFLHTFLFACRIIHKRLHRGGVYNNLRSA